MRALLICMLLAVSQAAGQVRFTEDFEGDLSGWALTGSESISIQDSGDPEHGMVLRLRSNEVVYALVKGPADWGSLRVTADFRFPEDAHSYLGFIYNFSDKGRIDFGSIYIKGKGSYLRVNPRRDGNVSRLLYEEFRTPLEGPHAIRIGKWHRMMAEVLGGTCHFYVDDMAAPKLTFDLYERADGLVGFEPRVAGAPVWIDNVEVTSIDRLSWQGPPIPRIEYQPEKLLTEWEVLGPFGGPVREVEKNPVVPEVRVNGKPREWQPFSTDRRGAVISGRITEYFGSRPVAYFRTSVRSETRREASLSVSTTDEIALFVNGVFEGFLYRDGYMSGEDDWNAWHDFWKRPDQAGRRVTLALDPGENVILFRVRNGQFASGGFFARLEPN